MIDRFKASGKVVGLSTRHLEQINTSVVDGFVKNKFRVPNRDGSEFIHLFTNPFNMEITLEGNLRKYWFGRNSAMNDFSYTSYISCIKFIATVLRIKSKHLWHLSIRRIEIGGNIKLKRKYADIIPAMKRYPRLYRVNYKKGTTKFKGTKKYIIAYDKLAEVLKNGNVRISKKNKEKMLKSIFILRFEISFFGLHGSGLKNELSTLLAVKNNWNDLIDFWVDSFGKIEVEDELGDIRKINKKTTECEKRD